MDHALSMDSLRARVPSAFATQAHESRSHRYTYIPTSDVIQAMITSGFQPFQASESRYRTPGKAGYTKHMLRFRQQNQQLIVGDSLFEIVLINSHDGSSAYKLMAGIFRLVCSNGMVVSESTFGMVHVRHSGNVVSEVIDASHKIIEGAPKVIEAVNGWRSLQLTGGEQQAFAEAARTLRFGDSEGNTETPITAAQLLAPRRPDDNKSDLWHTMNRVQENVIKGGISARGKASDGSRRLFTARHVKGIDQDVKLNKALWTLAAKMSELKGVAAA